MKPACSIAIVAPACPLKPGVAERVSAFAEARFGKNRVRLEFHPQCFLVDGHFAGDDAARSAAFLEAANDPSFDAVWFARGGYGSCRIEDRVWRDLGQAARQKTYLGYSDLGFMLARLWRDGIGRPAHGPMPSDINREGGEAAIARALDFLVANDATALEPSLAGAGRAAAFNLTILAALIGGPHEPDFSGLTVMIEEVSEYLYRIDRALFQATSSPNLRRAAGLMLLPRRR